MKYIRANDNKIYNTNELIKCEDKRFPDGWFTKNGVPLIAIKQADTIEELCDEFDWKWNEKEFPYSKTRQHDRYSVYGDLKRAIREEENYGKYLNQDYEIYGAIWTDKGLIYVAKMNDKGDLELL